MHLQRTVLTIALAATTATALPSFRTKQPAKDDVKCDESTCPHNGRYEQPGGRHEKRSERGGGGKVGSSWKDDEGYPKSNRVLGSGEREGGQALVSGDENTQPGQGQLEFATRKGGAPLTVARSYPSRTSGNEFGDSVNPHQGHSGLEQDYQSNKGGERTDFVKGSSRGNPDDFRSMNPDNFHSQGRKSNPDDLYSGGMTDFSKGGSPLVGPRNFHNRGPKQRMESERMDSERMESERMESERKGGAPVGGNFYTHTHTHTHGDDLEAQPAHNHLQTRQTLPNSGYQHGQSKTGGEDRFHVGNGNHGKGNTQDFVGGRNGDGMAKQDFVDGRNGDGMTNQDFVGGKNGDSVTKQDWVGQRGGHGNTQDFVGGRNGDGMTKKDFVRGQGNNGLPKTQDFVGGNSVGNTQDVVRGNGQNGEGVTKQDWVGQSRGHGNTQDFVGGRNGDGMTKQDFVRGQGNNGLPKTQDFVGGNSVGNTQDVVRGNGQNGEGVTKQDWVGQSRGHANTQDFVRGNKGLPNTQDFVGGDKQDWVQSSTLQTRQSGELDSNPRNGPVTASGQLDSGKQRQGCIEASKSGFRGVNGDSTC